MRASAPLYIALLSAISAFFTGCTPGTNLTSTANSGTATIQIAGHVHGGQQPVSGATIKLYTVGTSGDGSASTSLLSQSVTTDANGNFNITNLYSCTNATLVYLVATGGNPGLGSNNANIAMMAALGPCSSSLPIFLQGAIGGP
jgi:hypothetical protein